MTERQFIVPWTVANSCGRCDDKTVAAIAMYTVTNFECSITFVPIVPAPRTEKDVLALLNRFRNRRSRTREAGYTHGARRTLSKTSESERGAGDLSGWSMARHCGRWSPDQNDSGHCPWHRRKAAVARKK
jgi:hypothetical protein